jgi:hypothetical protein
MAIRHDLRRFIGFDGRQRFGFWRGRMKRLHGEFNRLHHLRFVDRIGLSGFDRQRHVIGTAGFVAERAEDDQAAAKDHREHNEFAALGLEEIEKISWFHG